VILNNLYLETLVIITLINKVSYFKNKKENKISEDSWKRIMLFGYYVQPLFKSISISNYESGQVID
jgi:hypothetical protein